MRRQIYELHWSEEQVVELAPEAELVNVDVLNVIL